MVNAGLLDERAEHFCRRAGLHGLEEFHEYYWGKPRRRYAASALWLVIFVVAFVLMIYFVCDAVGEFLSKPIITSYNIKPAPGGLALPLIYLCPSHPISDNAYASRAVNISWRRSHADRLLKFRPNDTDIDGFRSELITIGEAVARPLRPPAQPPRQDDCFPPQCANSPMGGGDVVPGTRPPPRAPGCDHPRVQGGAQAIVSNATSRRSPPNEVIRVTCAKGYQMFDADYSNFYESGALLRCTPMWDGRVFDWTFVDSGLPMGVDLLCSIALVPDSVEEYFMKAGADRETFISKCWLGTEPCPDGAVKQIFDGNYGKCFIVSLPNHLQQSPGAGITLEIDMALPSTRLPTSQTGATGQGPVVWPGGDGPGRHRRQAAEAAGSTTPPPNEDDRMATTPAQPQQRRTLPTAADLQSKLVCAPGTKPAYHNVHGYAFRPNVSLVNTDNIGGPTDASFCRAACDLATRCALGQGGGAAACQDEGVPMALCGAWQWDALQQHCSIHGARWNDLTVDDINKWLTPAADAATITAAQDCFPEAALADVLQWNFDVYPGKYLIGFTQRVATAGSLRDCLLECIYERAFDCESVVYFFQDPQDNCNLHTASRRSEPASFVSSTAPDLTGVYVDFSRHSRQAQVRPGLDRVPSAWVPPPPPPPPPPQPLPPPPRLANKQQFTVLDAVHLSVHDPQSFEPNKLASILLQPGSFVKIHVEKHQQLLLDRETPLPIWTGLAGSKLCSTDEEIETDFEFTMLDLSRQSAIAIGYSEGVCQLDCLVNVSVGACDCLPPVASRLLKSHVSERYDYCTPKQMQCVLGEEQLQSNRRCQQRCRSPCNTQIYRTQLSQTAFPSLRFRQLWDEMKRGNFWSDDRGEEFKAYTDAAESLDKLVVHISYSNLQYVEIEQEYAMTFTNFLANVGGLFGLWLGPSIVTLIRVIYVLIGVCLGKGRRKQPTADTENSVRPVFIGMSQPKSQALDELKSDLESLRQQMQLLQRDNEELKKRQVSAANEQFSVL